jgi:tRNA(His) 5'-end guanylyltransferase
MPVVIRLDGKAFHTFTRGMRKPFDDVFVKTMQETMLYLCKNIQGCVLGYTQSDEITLILVDYQSLDTCAWFDNKVQKMCSISASMATLAFNKNFGFEYEELNRFVSECKSDSEEDVKYMNIIYNKLGNAMFDSRVFNLPKEEVTNCLIWRQQDAVRNSIQSVGQANFSQKELMNKNCNMIQDMLMTQKGINWNDIPIHLKRGSCCIKKLINPWDAEFDHKGNFKMDWIIDKEIPTFTQDREYIEKLINY